MTAYEQSGNEAIRLSRENKQFKADKAAWETQRAELQARIDETPPFKLLTEEELATLDVPKQTDYLIKKNAWETDKAKRKENLTRVQAENQRVEKETTDFIYSRSAHMNDNPAEYPDYGTLMPVMETILDRAPFLGGMRESPDILYYCAKGLQAHRQAKTQKTLEDKAAADAAAQAAATAGAAGTGSPSAPVGGPAPAPDDDSDEAHNARILKKVQKPIFTVAGTQK